jgi:hypothetical protein
VDRREVLVARLSGTDRKTVRYVATSVMPLGNSVLISPKARACGLDRVGGVCQLIDKLLGGDCWGSNQTPQSQERGVGNHCRRARADQGVARDEGVSH